jgi:hypothetical protein
MKISVTQKHIDEGNVGDCAACPIALALARAFETRDVYAGTYSLCVENKCFSTPEVARNFMGDFDAGGPVSPFSFDLPLESGE